MSGMVTIIVKPVFCILNCIVAFVLVNKNHSTSTHSKTLALPINFPVPDHTLTSEVIKNFLYMSPPAPEREWSLSTLPFSLMTTLYLLSYFMLIVN